MNTSSYGSLCCPALCIKITHFLNDFMICVIAVGHAAEYFEEFMWSQAYHALSF